MKDLIILLVITTLSCSEVAQDSTPLRISTKKVFRLTPDGTKELEQYIEFDAVGQIKYMKDYMDGEPYMHHWMVYNGGKIQEKLSAKCEECEQTKERSIYQGNRLVRKEKQDLVTYFEYDEKGNCTLSYEVSQPTLLLERFKTRTYQDSLLISQRAYKFYEDSIPFDRQTIDSLLAVPAQPYHVLENIYNDKGILIASHYDGAVDEWFKRHKMIYDKQGNLVEVQFTSPSGESGGSRLFEFTYY